MCMYVELSMYVCTYSCLPILSLSSSSLSSQQESADIHTCEIRFMSTKENRKLKFMYELRHILVHTYTRVHTHTNT